MEKVEKVGQKEKNVQEKRKRGRRRKKRGGEKRKTLQRGAGGKVASFSPMRDKLHTQAQVTQTIKSMLKYQSVLYISIYRKRKHA